MYRVELSNETIVMLQMGTIICLVLLWGVSNAVVVTNSVVFNKVNEITTTRSRWLVSLVTDLNPFEHALEKLLQDVGSTQKAIRKLTNQYDRPEQRGYNNILAGLRKEVKSLRKTRNFLTKRFVEYHSLQRQKRSLIPVIGKALGVLFGTITEDDLDTVKTNINQMHRTQQEFAHVLTDSVTIVNITREQVMENRHSLNSLINSVQALDQEIANVTGALEEHITELEQFVQVYLQVDLAIETLKQAIQGAVMYLEHLSMQLDMLSLGHLSPSVVAPDRLRSLLVDLSKHIPSYLELPENPDTKLWDYYQFLTCQTVLMNTTIVTVIDIPLLDTGSTYEIYEVYNLPVPHENRTGAIIQYKLESTALAINPERTRYNLMGPNSAAHCTSSSIRFCDMEGAVYPINLSQTCLIALFMKNNDGIKQNCILLVEPLARLPAVRYITNGLWVIATQREQTFTILCHQGKSTTKTAVVKPPMGTLKLDMTCSASNGRLSLRPYYREESAYGGKDDYGEILTIGNSTGIKLWDPITRSFPGFGKLDLPEELKEMERIPLDSLVRRLHWLESVSRGAGIPIRTYGGIGAGVFSVILVAIIVYCICKNRICSALVRNDDRYRSSAPSGYQPVSAAAEGASSTRKESISMPPDNRDEPTMTLQTQEGSLAAEASTKDDVGRRASPIWDLIQPGQKVGDTRPRLPRVSYKTSAV